MREIADDGLPDDGVESLFQDDAGRIWAFTANGAAYFENGRFIPGKYEPMPTLIMGIRGNDASAPYSDWSRLADRCTR